MAELEIAHEQDLHITCECAYAESCSTADFSAKTGATQQTSSPMGPHIEAIPISLIGNGCRPPPTIPIGDKRYRFLLGGF